MRVTELFPPFCSALLRSQLCLVWAPQFKKNMDNLQRVQRRTTKVTSGLGNIRKRLKEFGLFCLEKRKVNGDAISLQM